MDIPFITHVVNGLFVMLIFGSTILAVAMLAKDKQLSNAGKALWFVTFFLLPVVSSTTYIIAQALFNPQVRKRTPQS